MRPILVVALLLMSVVAHSQPGPLREPGNQSPDHQQIRGNDALDAIASQLSAIREQTARIEKERTDRDANPFWPPIISNWVLILLTSGAVVAAWMTLGKMERQTKAAEKAADAANTSAESAKKSAKLSEQTLYLGMRARLGLENAIIHSWEPDKVVRMEFIFKNYGGKAARLLEYCIVNLNQPLPDKPIYRDWKKLNTVLNSGATHGIDSVLLSPLKPDVWALVNADDLPYRFRMYGAVKYDDGFGNVKTIGFHRYYDAGLSRRRGATPLFGTGDAPDGYDYTD